MRGVFSFVALLSPVESSILPSEALGAHSLLVRLGAGARKRFFRFVRETLIPHALNGLNCEFSRLLDEQAFA